MKSLNEMDLEEWELLPDEGFLEINDDGGKKIYSRKYPDDSSCVFQTNYFICPPKSVDKTVVPPDQLLPVPIDLQPQQYQVPVEIKINPPAASEKIKSFSGGDQDPVSQVFFKKMKGTEFVDMKVDSPRSSSSRGLIVPQMDFQQFEEKKGDVISYKEADMVDHSEMVMEKSEKMGLDHEDGGGVNNIWKWSLTGIGAICSFGVAAATFCIISFSSQRKKNKHPQQNQKLQFQIYANDKRMKQVVHQARKLNEAISAVRGVPITRARITFGGYYDASL